MFHSSNKHELSNEQFYNDKAKKLSKKVLYQFLACERGGEIWHLRLKPLLGNDTKKFFSDIDKLLANTLGVALISTICKKKYYIVNKSETGFFL